MNSFPVAPAATEYLFQKATAAGMPLSGTFELTPVCNMDCKMCYVRMSGAEQAAVAPLRTGEQWLDLAKRCRDAGMLYLLLTGGEPFLHPLLPHFIATAREKGFVPVITTNGTLLKNASEILLAHPHKVQISIHSHEGNGKENPEAYMSEVMTFAKEAAQQGIIVVLRLWNEGGYDSNNERLLQLAAQHQPHPWTERYDGWKLATNLYIEFDKMFEWPDEEHPEYEEEEVFCYALRNQIGVLVDGTVVPCCLDHDGDLALGNLLEHNMEDILESDRAQAIYRGFQNKHAAEELCRKCGYARRFG